MVFIFKFEESSGVFSICNASFSSWNLNFVAQVDDMRNRGSDKFITWSTACIRRGESVTRYTILSGCAKSKADFALINKLSATEVVYSSETDAHRISHFTSRVLF